MNTEIHFGERIKQVLEQSGLSMDEAASRIGYKRESVYPIFKKKDVGTELLKKVAKAYRLDIGYFFAGDINQTGRVNTVGESYINYSQRDNSDKKLLEKENDGLKAENRALRDQIETLKEMVQLLKERGK